MKAHGLFRRAVEEIRSYFEDITTAIRLELNESSANIGYRRMHKVLLSKGFISRREDVRKVMRQLDPEGVELRRRRLRRRKYISPGPNHSWHIDGYDKLISFGFSIHGCIDGFSRKLIWLKVGPSNTQPEIIANYYLNAIESIGLPKKVTADDGTEHSLIEPIHITLRSLGGEDAFDSFNITTSPKNQRIEAYWSLLQRDKIG